MPERVPGRRGGRAAALSGSFTPSASLALVTVMASGPESPLPAVLPGDGVTSEV